MTITILKALSVIVILVIMIMVLVIINHFFAGGFDSSPAEIDHLREEVQEEEDVVSSNSSFSELVRARATTHESERTPQKDNDVMY